MNYFFLDLELNGIQRGILIDNIRIYRFKIMAANIYIC
jgi:hypothetical protein